MTQPTHPLRVRLYGGRSTHAAREMDAAVELACGGNIDILAPNHWMPNTATVTCKRCTRTLNEGGAQ